ncbi:translation initiation factor 2 [uncultured Desulfovibrio sp.]|uniref:translation initiation factor 2 n=1 Tax=uncultured Desulfovibrio sp. TaxID=167968 RepID=UPI002630F4B1|nr:translation initiation factor 2 [uncultured Desulfovibrio sp.]
MQAFAREVITRAALAAGLPEGRVIDIVKKDNLTIKRPRVELQFLPEKYTRTGRKLAVYRTETTLIRKRELYEVELTVNANALADDRAWLEAFSAEFVANLPRGGNDSRGNWIRVRAQRATFGRSPDKRVGEKVIEVFTRVNRLFVLTFTGRITGEELAELIPSLTITTCIRQQGEAPYGDEKECGRGTGRAG